MTESMHWRCSIGIYQSHSHQTATEAMHLRTASLVSMARNVSLSSDSGFAAQRKRPTVRNHPASILLRPRLCARKPEPIPTQVILTKPQPRLCTCVQSLWNRWSRAAFKVWTAATGRSVSDQQFETIWLAYSYDRDYALDMLTRYLPKSFTPNRNSVYALAYSLFGIDGAERLSKFGQRLRGAA